MIAADEASLSCVRPYSRTSVDESVDERRRTSDSGSASAKNTHAHARVCHTCIVSRYDYARDDGSRRYRVFAGHPSRSNEQLPTALVSFILYMKLIALIRARPKGISDEDLSNEMPDLKPLQRAKFINKLLSQGYIELFKRAGLLFYRFEDSSKIIKDVTIEEKIVYKIIKEVDNKGIWIGDIRKKTNLTHTQLQNILKNLEAKQLIKTMKSNTSNRKMYLLYDLEPDVSITGSVWYQNNDIETEFVNILSEQCYRFLEQKREKLESCHVTPIAVRNATFASSQEIWKFILDLGISKVKLSVKDIEMILNTLIYDGKVERISSGDNKNLYKSIRPLVNLPGLMRNPCGLCPVRMQCRDEGRFTPITCQYLREWLE